MLYLEKETHDLGEMLWSIEPAHTESAFIFSLLGKRLSANFVYKHSAHWAQNVHHTPFNHTINISTSLRKPKGTKRKEKKRKKKEKKLAPASPIIRVKPLTRPVVCDDEILRNVIHLCLVTWRPVLDGGDVGGSVPSIDWPICTKHPRNKHTKSDVTARREKVCKTSTHELTSNVNVMACIYDETEVTVVGSTKIARNVKI